MTTPLNPLKDPRLYVLAWLTTNRISVNERGELKEKLNRHLPDIFDTMWLDYKSQVNAHNAVERNKAPAQRNIVNAVAEKDMMKALTELISKEKATFRQRSIQALRCDGEDLSELERYIEAITGSIDPVHVGVMAHWLYMIKNKMQQKDTSYHIMPIYFGKQGGGKTVAINKLIKPIENYKMSLSMRQVTDDRYFFSMSENYVMFFDEMQGASKTDVNCLKNVITTEWLDARRLGTNGVFKVRQSCSFIGATNRPVSEQIIDATGMRRFWEIKTLEKLNWELLNSIDFDKIWKGIDENKEDGYIVEHLDAIREKQEEMTIEDEFDVFMEDYSIVPANETDEDAVLVPTNSFYQVYKNWSFNAGHKTHNKIWFGKRLSNKGINNKQKKIDGRNGRYYIVKDSCTIKDLDVMSTVQPLRRANV